MPNSWNLQKKTDSDGILLSPRTASRDLAKGTDFTEADATKVLLWLDQAGFDILIFGCRNGELYWTDGESKGSTRSG